MLAHASRASAFGAGGEGARVVAVSTLAEAIGALSAAAGPVVVVSDGMDDSCQDGLAVAIRARPEPAIEVRGERSDGVSHSPLSAACRGVISGFGDAGIRAAVGLAENL